MKLRLKCEQDCSAGQKRGHKHLGVKCVGCVVLEPCHGGEALECGDKAPSFASFAKLTQSLELGQAGVLVSADGAVLAVTDRRTYLEVSASQALASALPLPVVQLINSLKLYIKETSPIPLRVCLS